MKWNESGLNINPNPVIILTPKMSLIYWELPFFILLVKEEYLDPKRILSQMK